MNGEMVKLVIYQVSSPTCILELFGKPASSTEYAKVWEGRVAEEIIDDLSANFNRGSDGLLDWHERVFGPVNMHSLSPGDVFSIEENGETTYYKMTHDGCEDVTAEWLTHTTDGNGVH